MLAEYLARSGMDDSEIAGKLGISEKTLNNWKTAHKKFFQSLKNGKEGIDDGVERALLRRAMGFYREHAVKLFYDKNTGEVVQGEYTEYFPPDVTACIFWLKNRRKEKWRDRIEHTGEGGNPIEHTHDLHPDLRAMVQQLVAATSPKPGADDVH